MLILPDELSTQSLNANCPLGHNVLKGFLGMFISLDPVRPSSNQVMMANHVYIRHHHTSTNGFFSFASDIYAYVKAVLCLLVENTDYSL